MRQITQFIIICSFILPQCIFANSKQPLVSEALEISVNQQLLSQKIAKIYLILCHDLRNPKLYEDRRIAIEKFEEQLYQLSLFIPNERVKEHIQEVRVVWKRFKSIADWSIKKEAINSLLIEAKQLLKASKMLHSAYQEYEYTIKDNNDWITINQYMNHVQHQKVLVQQILTYYMANEPGSELLDYSIDLEIAQKSFVRIWAILENATTTSASIQEHLELIRIQWQSILMQLGKGKETSDLDQILENGVAIEENIQNVMDSYAVLSANLSLSYTIEKGAGQCILVQQMATNYVISKHEEVKYIYEQKIVEQIADFEQNMESMSLTTSKLEIREAIKVVNTMWKNYKKLLIDFETLNEVQILKTLEQGQVLMAACDQVNLKIKEHTETIFSYQQILPQNNEDALMSEDVITQIELLNKLKIDAQRSTLYFMLIFFEWDVDLSLRRFADSRNNSNFLIKKLDTSIKETNRRVLWAEIQTIWNHLNDLYKEETTTNFLEVVASKEALEYKISKLREACIYELNQLFAQDLQLNY